LITENRLWLAFVSVPAAQWVRLASQAAAVVAEADPGADVITFGHVADGNVHVNIVPAATAAGRQRFPACPVSPARPPRNPDPRACPRRNGHDGTSWLSQQHQCSIVAVKPGAQGPPLCRPAALAGVPQPLNNGTR